MSDLTEAIKLRLGITGNYHDKLLDSYASDVMEFMYNGGVGLDVLNSPEAYGVIARGVQDQWNFGSGGGEYSNSFIQRVTQLAYRSHNSTVTFVPMTKEDIERCAECLND